MEHIHGQQAHICFDGVQMGRSKVFLGAKEVPPATTSRHQQPIYVWWPHAPPPLLLGGAVQCVQINDLRDAALHRFALVIQTRFVHLMLAAAAEVAGGGWWLLWRPWPW